MVEPVDEVTAEDLRLKIDEINDKLRQGMESRRLQIALILIGSMVLAGAGYWLGKRRRR